jgi:hypothetical protein
MTNPIEEERPEDTETGTNSGGDVEVGPSGDASTDSGGDVEVGPGQPA